MKKQTVLLVSCVLLGIALLGVGIVWASSVTVRVGSVQAAPDSVAEVPIQAQGASNIGAMHLELVYDASVVTPETVNRGPLPGDNALLEFNADTPGRLAIGLITMDAMQGDGAIATVRFKVVGQAGQKSALTLENCRAWEGTTHLDVLVNTEPGQVTVEAAGWTNTLILALVALLCCVVIVVVLVFGIVAWRRRGRPRAAVAGPPWPVAQPTAPPSWPAAQPTAPPPPGRLVVAQGKANRPYVDLPLGGLTIGRKPACGLVLSDPLVSGEHARLDFVGGTWVLHDLDSRNGTYVNGVRVASQSLRLGDQIQLGQVVLRFQ